MMLSLTLLALACTEEPETVDPGPDPAHLEPPSLDGIDVPGAFEEMLALGLAVDMRPAWQGHVDTLAMGEPGCPDLYTGMADEDMMMDAPGLSWSDRCRTTAGDTFAGFVYWENDLVATTDETSGTYVDGVRSLEADGVVADGDAVLYEFDGEGTDAMSLIEDGEYVRWTYASQLRATVTGSVPFGDGALAGGWRTDMQLNYSGGDVDRLSAQGNVFLFESRVQDRFDSLNVNIELIGPTGAGPEDCQAEPLGYISLRDEDAFWYDLVFQPRYGDDDDYDNDPYSDCDGCGVLYVRGVEQPDPVCPDFDWIWATLSPPDPADYVLSTRDLGEED
ncbi:MAG: hypothetical protein H6739_07125 [Alphaproteobacteria bacterium]|nr:hypothetical protein [Alphaproteobacteria bacterium]